jgi:hypothetical protein
MGEVFKSLVYCDYPEKWPGLLEAVYGHLTSHVRTRPREQGRACGHAAAQPAHPSTLLWPIQWGVGSAWLVRLGSAPALGASARPTLPTHACHVPLPRSRPQDELRVYGGLMALRFMARKYEFRDAVRGREGGKGGGLQAVRAATPG